MSDILIIKIVFGIFLSVFGTVSLLLAFTIGYKYLVEGKRCTSKIKGIIKKYTIAEYGAEGSGIHLPVVYYNVNGKEYKVVGPRYKMCKIVEKRTPFSKNEMNYKEDNQVLIINRESNSFVGISKNPIAEMYPLNSEIDVYYDPSNPKLSYVLRCCNNKWKFWLMFYSGVLVILLDIIILIVL